MTQLYDYEKFGCPFTRGNYSYHFYNSGLMPQSVLHQTRVDLQESKVFFDPNTLSEDGTHALSTFAFSDSGKLFAYAISKSGSDWVTIHAKSVDSDVSGGDSPSNNPVDQLHWAKFTSMSFTHDDLGFFYTRYPSPSSSSGNVDAGTETDTNLFGKLYYHWMGTEQDKDRLIFQDLHNGKSMFGAEVSDDGNFVVITVTESCDPVNKLYVMRLRAGSKGALAGGEEEEIIPVMATYEAEFSYITNNGSIFYFKTNLNAPRYKVVFYDLNCPKLVGSLVYFDVQGFQNLIPEMETVLQDVLCVNGDSLILHRLVDVKVRVGVR